MSTDDTLEIVICMGSSCFARGNQENLAVVEDYIARHDLSGRINLVGSRCEGQCRQGPNIRIAGQTYHGVDAGSVLELLERHLSAAATEAPATDTEE